MHLEYKLCEKNQCIKYNYSSVPLDTLPRVPQETCTMYLNTDIKVVNINLL